MAGKGFLAGAWGGAVILRVGETNLRLDWDLTELMQVDDDQLDQKWDEEWASSHGVDQRTLFPVNVGIVNHMKTMGAWGWGFGKVGMLRRWMSVNQCLWLRFAE